MSEPTKASVEAAIDKCDELGEEAFVKLVSAGNNWRSHIVISGAIAYPLKAIWAFAHDPLISPADFNTKDAVKGLQSFDYYCFKLLDR